MLSQSNTLVYYTTLVLALFHASTAIASPTPTTKRDVKNTVQAPPITQSGTAARLRQTSWREIQARSALRKSPLYRRQASAVPYPTCQATYSNLLGVARYPNVELYGGDVSCMSRVLQPEADAASFLSSALRGVILCGNRDELFGHLSRHLGVSVFYVMSSQ